MTDTSKPPWWVWFEPPTWFPRWLHLLTCTYCRGLRAIRAWNARAFERAKGGEPMTPSYRPGRIRSGAGTPDPW
jgi:hypothetical protein